MLTVQGYKITTDSWQIMLPRPLILNFRHFPEYSFNFPHFEVVAAVVFEAFVTAIGCAFPFSFPLSFSHSPSALLDCIAIANCNG